MKFDKRNALSREEVFNLINGERSYQMDRWNMKTTNTNGRHAKPEEWLIYIQDYLYEAMNIATRSGDPEAGKRVMDNIRKIAAMGVAAMEQIGCERREGY